MTQSGVGKGDECTGPAIWHGEQWAVGGGFPIPGSALLERLFQWIGWLLSERM